MTVGRVRTVLGDVSPEELGHTQPHEHVLCDFSSIVGATGLVPLCAGEEPVVGPAPELSSTARRLLHEPVRLDNYDAIRREVINVDNLRMLSEGDAIAELRHYKAAGGGAVVDSTSVGLGRDPLGLARVSRATGVQIVMGSGWYVRDFHPRGLAELTIDELADQMVADVAVGVGSTRIRAGILGEIGLSWPVHPVEERVLQAAALAQRRTGAALQIHPGRDPGAPLAALDVVERAGGDVRRTIMSHVDRTLTSRQQLVELARRGCYVELDLFGQESSYYALSPVVRRPNDATRVDWMRALLDAGYGDRVLMAQDICQKVYLRRYGGPGYTHILEQVIPLCRRMGLSDDELDELTVRNPAEALALL